MRPLGEHVIGGHIIPDVIEVPTKGASGFPPPGASLRSEYYSDSSAWSAVGEVFGSLVDGHWFARIPRLSERNGPRGVFRGLDQMVDLHCLGPISQYAAGVGHDTRLALYT